MRLIFNHTEQEYLAAVRAYFWIQTSNIDAKVAWSLYSSFIEKKSFNLLVYGKEPASVTVIPKRVFESSEQEDAFRMLLQKHISPKK